MTSEDNYVQGSAVGEHCEAKGDSSAKVGYFSTGPYYVYIQ